MGVGSDFEGYLDQQVSKFENAILSDYWKYKRIPVEEAGFSFLETLSKDYYRQKYFEIRIEDYIRRYLANGFFGRVLEARGNGIYPCWLPDNYSDKSLHFTNKQYESITQFEFVADFLSNNKRIAIRYTDIEKNDLQLSDDIDEVNIVSWKIPGHINGKDKILIGSVSGKKIYMYCLRAFMYEHGFTKDEYEEYIIAVSYAVDAAVELIGTQSIPRLNNTVLFEFRFELERFFLKQISDWKSFKKTEKKLKKEYPEALDRFNWGYSIIDSSTKEKYPELEAKSKELLFSTGSLKRFEKNKYYLALIGKNSYAKSFCTSEYLYKHHHGRDIIDYTSIISGYLKSIEQLLYQIVMLYLNMDCKIKKKGGNKYSRTTFSEENLENCDISLGPLIYFLKDNPKVLLIERKYKKWVFNCLMTYVNECRNDSFHKHNIDSWARVEIIRRNTYFLYTILLGCCQLGDSEKEIDRSIGLVRNDKMERAYNWIINVPEECFFVEFFCEDPIKVSIGKKTKLPNFNNYGFIKDYIIFLECVDSIDPVVNKPNITFIKRDRLPEKMWYINKNGKKIEFKN